MLPRLQAEERMAEINAIAAGTGNMKKHDHGRYTGDLKRRAAGNGARKAARPTPASFGAMGIAVVINGPSKAAEGDLSDG